jgi:hypothetical protein
LVYDRQVDDGDNVAVKMTLMHQDVAWHDDCGGCKAKDSALKASVTPLSILSGIRPESQHDQ